MSVRFSIIGPKDAMVNPGFIVPWVMESKDFSDYTFYAAIADERLAGILVADKKIFEPEILSIGISPEYQGKGLGTAILEYAEYDILIYDNLAFAKVKGNYLSYYNVSVEFRQFSQKEKNYMNY